MRGRGRGSCGGTAGSGGREGRAGRAGGTGGAAPLPPSTRGGEAVGLLLLLLPEVKTKVDDDEDEDDEEGATCDPFWARKEERSFSRDPKKASSFCLMLSFFRVVGVVGVVVVVVVNGEELLNVGGVVAEWRGGVVLLGGGDALALEFGSTCPAATACCFLSFFFLPNILAPLVHSASLCPDCVVRDRKSVV